MARARRRGGAPLWWALGPPGLGFAPPFLSLALWAEWGGAPAHLGAGSTPTWPTLSPGVVAPLRWSPGATSGGPGGPGTLPVMLETLPVSETIRPIYQSLPPDHSGAPRDVRDLIRDSEQLSVTLYNNSL